LFGAKLVITFFAPVQDVSLDVSPGIKPSTIVAFNGSQQIASVPLSVLALPFAGPLTRLEIRDAIPEQVVLRRVTFATFAPAPETVATVTAFLGTAAVSERRVSGTAGQTATATFEMDAINRIEIVNTAAALIDLCVSSVSRAANVGWAEVPRIQNPIGLPVVHPSYPLSAINAAAATTLALNRVKYGPVARWQGVPLQELQTQLAQMVKGGPTGTHMAAQTSPATDSLGTHDAPSMPALHPLDLVLLGALHPALAQIVGLAFVDESAPANTSFDYMIVGDYTGVGQKDANKVLALIKANDFSQLEAFIVFNKRREPAPPLTPPAGLKTFPLPGMTTTAADGTVIDATNNVGLNWAVGRSSTNTLLPGAAILYHLWRTSLGNGSSPQAPGTFAWLTGPATSSDPNDSDNAVFVTTPRLPGGSRPERPPGWPPAATPLHYIDRGLTDGWYGFKAVGTDIFGRHSADSQLAVVRVQDKTPPPCPAAVEAYVLDDADPALLKDTIYNTWRALRPSVTGLRVRWTWTGAHMRQAPDTKEFRIHFNPGAELPGPDARAATNWQTRQFVVDFGAHVTIGFSPATDRNGTPYQGTVTAVDANAKRVTLQSAAPLSELSRLSAQLLVGNGAPLPILSANDTSVIVPSIAGIAPGAAWAIRYPVRVYEVLLPLAGDPPVDVPLAPTIQDPLLYAHVGVAAADDKTTADNPKWASGKWGGRSGNEGGMSAPAKVYRVLRTPPAAPQPMGGDAPVFATRANIDGESFYTFRWHKAAFLKTHIFRALFDSVAKTDWRIRTTRAALDPNALGHADLFPAEWTLATKQAAALKLNAIATKTAYGALTDDEKRLLAALPGNRAPGELLADRDWLIRTTRKQLSANDAAFFPPSWATDANRRQQVAAALNGIQKIDDYQALTDDALRILAGLPGIELAFSQITIQPLGDDNLDVRGPDDPPSYVADPTALAYRDRLPGLTSARYFYRSALVTAAHNVSPLGLAGPPVYVPNVGPPLMPVIDSVKGADREIALSWRASNETNLRERRVYRAGNEATAADIRDMEKVAALPIATTLWKDTVVVAGRTFFYRVTAVNADGVESVATPAVAARAYDDAHPDPPLWSPVQSDPQKLHVVLQWTSLVNDLRCLLQRRASAETAWTSLTAWLKPGVYQSRDDAREVGKQYIYRLLVRDTAERQNRAFNELTF
jgi:hypothetical protein